MTGNSLAKGFARAVVIGVPEIKLAGTTVVVVTMCAMVGAAVIAALEIMFSGTPGVVVTTGTLVGADMAAWEIELVGYALVVVRMVAVPGAAVVGALVIEVARGDFVGVVEVWTLLGA